MGGSLLDEELIALGAVAKQFPAARGERGRVHTSTVSRWCLKGAKARNGEVIRLEHVRVGSRVLTTRSAVARFVAALTAADHTSNTPIRTPAERTRASEAASLALAEMGA